MLFSCDKKRPNALVFGASHHNAMPWASTSEALCAASMKQWHWIAERRRCVTLILLTMGRGAYFTSTVPWHGVNPTGVPWKFHSHGQVCALVKTNNGFRLGNLRVWRAHKKIRRLIFIGFEAGIFSDVQVSELVWLLQQEQLHATNKSMNWLEI